MDGAGTITDPNEDGAEVSLTEAIRVARVRTEADAAFAVIDPAILEAESLQSTGARLRWLRSRSGKSMGDLARFLGCSVEEVSNMERDRVGLKGVL